jgi:hypothetical protein
MTRISRRTVISAVVVLVSLGALAWAPRPATATAPSRRFPTRTIEAGEVTVELKPTRVDKSGAVVDITLDTHAIELDMNLRRASSLTVDGIAWPTVRYRGDGSGGHHREGTLRFRAAGPTKGQLRIRISGLPGRVVASWPV